MFLANLLHGGDTPVDINALPAPFASTQALLDEWLGVDTGDLTRDEIDALRPEVYEALGASARDTVFLKVHDAYGLTARGRPLFPRPPTRGAIYLIRNPLDVAVSYAHHLATPIDAVIERMRDVGDTVHASDDRGHLHARQRISTWSEHVRSWTSAPPFPVHVMRYEDMLREPLAAFTAAARFAGLPADPERVRRALEFSALGELRRQESERGFREKHPDTARFFREGRVGAWKETLTLEQVAAIIRDHGDVMRRFGYETEGIAS